jgi:sugar/nucleoside kinase (ribokinase family)
MNTPSSLAHQTAARLREDRDLSEIPALLGFDGFIDSIYQAVDQRLSASEYTRVKTLEAFGLRIVGAAGKSTNVELVLQDIKLGGNGPIMANAMSALGVPVTYCGMTGYPNVHPIFEELSNRARLLSIAEPALTDAVEFEDGKLIVGKHATVADVSHHNIVERIGEVAWRVSWQSARFVAMVNWTMLPYMTELWKKILDSEDFDQGERKTIFFDLADPEKRTEADILDAMQTIARFQKAHDVLLGLNEKEGEHIARVLGVTLSAESATHEDRMMDLAAAIREKLGISVCVVHPTYFAAAADANGTAVAAGPYTANPKISTGAGDHFNSGFCLGQLLGLNLAESLQTGVGVSGYYVRTAVSPSREQLAEFLGGL